MQFTPRVHLKASEVKTVKYDGRDHIIVPVIMARGDVVMNDALTPEDEYFPPAWNGVPVTVGHPKNNEGHLAANSPEVLLGWHIGRIFNTQVVGKTLRAEAWIDVERAEKIAPGLVADLKSGTNIDVSTGYFCEELQESGEINGQKYTAVHRDLRPDHLAFLPNEQGACSWKDGCGVRANGRLNLKLHLNEQATKALDAVNAALAAFKVACGLTTQKGDCDCKDPDDCECEEKPKENSLTKEEIEAMIANAVKASATASAAAIQTAVDAAVSTAIKANASALSDTDKAALAFANKTFAENKAALVAKIVANSTMKKEAIESFDMATLEVIANGLKPAAPVANYLRAVVNEAAGDDSVALSMEPPSIINSLRKKEAA